jgi:hypothetical protein
MKKNFLYLFMAAVLPMGFAACDDPTELPDKYDPEKSGVVLEVPTNDTIPAAEGTKSIRVSTNQSAWRAEVEPNSWCSVTRSATNVMVKVTENGSADTSRSVRITISSDDNAIKHTILLVQRKADARIDGPPAELVFKNTGSDSKTFSLWTNSTTFQVVDQPVLTWATSETIHTTIRDTIRDSLKVTVSTANTTVDPERVDTMYLRSAEMLRKIVLRQPISINASVNKSTINIGGTTASDTIILTSNVNSYTAVSSVAWCSVSTETADEQKRIILTPQQYPSGSRRTGRITITARDANGNQPTIQNVTINQYSQSGVSESELNFTANAASKNIDVFTDESTISVSTPNPSGWCTVRVGTGASSKTVTVEVTRYEQGDPRNYTFNIIAGSTTTQIRVVQQAAARATLTMDTAMTFDHNGGTQKVKVETATGGHFTVSPSAADWFVYRINAAGDSIIVTTTQKNLTGTARESVLNVTSGDNTKRLHVKQTARNVTETQITLAARNFYTTKLGANSGNGAGNLEGYPDDGRCTAGEQCDSIPVLSDNQRATIYSSTCAATGFVWGDAQNLQVNLTTGINADGFRINFYPAGANRPTSFNIWVKENADDEWTFVQGFAYTAGQTGAPPTNATSGVWNSPRMTRPQTVSQIKHILFEVTKTAFTRNACWQVSEFGLFSVNFQ